MARLPDGRVGVLYEPAGDTEIRFLTFDMEWLDRSESAPTEATTRDTAGRKGQ